ncbi:MAG: transmembrane 220 family protein [Saprospiraceae bacterium]|jgi:uncharacterized membrane protein|nr:transmembrane 220 family protein [Saprospiraceae bacterium]
MKYIANILIGILFLLFAYFQINDPDPAVWIAIYAAVGLSSLAAIFRNLPTWLPLVGVGLCIAWVVALLPAFINWLQMGAPSITESMKAEKPHIEYTREFLGLIICGIGFGFLYFQAKKRNH